MNVSFSFHEQIIMLNFDRQYHKFVIKTSMNRVISRLQPIFLGSRISLKVTYETMIIFSRQKSAVHNVPHNSSSLPSKQSSKPSHLPLLSTHRPSLQRNSEGKQGPEPDERRSMGMLCRKQHAKRYQRQNHKSKKVYIKQRKKQTDLLCKNSYLYRIQIIIGE